MKERASMNYLQNWLFNTFVGDQYIFRISEFSGLALVKGCEPFLLNR